MDSAEGTNAADVDTMHSQNEYPSFPVATIVMVSDSPMDEIAFGSKITLVAEIADPQVGMLLQWQHLPADMEPSEDDWVCIEGATESIYT